MSNIPRDQFTGSNGQYTFGGRNRAAVALKVLRLRMGSTGFPFARFPDEKGNVTGSVTLAVPADYGIRKKQAGYIRAGHLEGESRVSADACRLRNSLGRRNYTGKWRTIRPGGELHDPNVPNAFRWKPPEAVTARI